MDGWAKVGQDGPVKTIHFNATPDLLCPPELLLWECDHRALGRVPYPSEA